MAIVPDLSGNNRGAVAGSSFGSKPTDVHYARERAIPMDRSYPVVASDTVDLPNGACEYLVIGTGGALKVSYPNGGTDTINLPAGLHRVSVTRVWSTGTTAALISAGY
jgi:hypothetical protein